MRVLRYIMLVVLSLGYLFGIYSYQLTYATCTATASDNAVNFLKDCAADNSYGAVSPTAGDSITSIKILVTKVAERAITFGALFAIGALVFSGIQYTTSYGDDEKVKKAKTTGIYALIGLLLLLVAFPMVNIVVEFVYNIASK